VRFCSNVSPLSRLRVSRYDRCAAVIGSSPVFHSSGSRWSPGSFVSCVPMWRSYSKVLARAAATRPWSAAILVAWGMRASQADAAAQTEKLSGDPVRWLYQLKLDGSRPSLTKQTESFTSAPATTMTSPFGFRLSAPVSPSCRAPTDPDGGQALGRRCASTEGSSL